MQQGPGKILNVDDHLPTRYARTRVLKQAGFEVEEAATGAEALLRVAATRPELVLLDVNLPDISGFEVCRRIKRDPSAAHTTILYLTAYASGPGDKVRGFEEGGLAYLVEPIEPEVLVATVRALIREHEAEMALHRLAAIVEFSDDAIIGHTLEGMIVDWNAAAERLYGYTAAEMRAHGLQALFAPAHAAEYPGILERLRRGECVRNFVTRHVRRDGTPVDVALTVSPVRDRAGVAIGGSTIARDITERRLIDRQVLRSQKLESLGVLAGGLAHDFNNLLTGVLGNASLAMEELPSRHPARPLLDEVVRAGERAAHLTNQMLAYAGMGRFVVATVDVPRMLLDSRALLEAVIPDIVELRFEFPERVPLVEADPSQIQQLVLNLVTSAAEAIPEGQPGLVRIVAGAARIDEPSHDLRAGTYLCLEVHDNGCGMDEETLARIYDPFFSTKFTGRGLGLPAVFGIVRASQGGLRVDSSPDRGTVFRVYLPACDLAAAPGRHTVLVVDDEEFVRQTARSVLEKQGFSVLLAEDGIAAVEVFERHAAGISLVLLDLTMPGMNGEHVIPRLREIRRDVPIVVMSGYDETQASRRLAGLGVAGFIHKPYTVSQLAERVRAAMTSAA